MGAVFRLFQELFFQMRHHFKKIFTGSMQEPVYENVGDDLVADLVRGENGKLFFKSSVLIRSYLAVFRLGNFIRV